MESFYGGKKGTSFVLVKQYTAISEMAKDFTSGDCKVKYGQYVIINTEPNRNDPDNGRIYMRGYDAQRTEVIQRVNYAGEPVKEETIPTGGGIHVGTICGPAGRAPQLIINSYQAVENIKDEENFEYRKGKGTYTFQKGDLLPGKVGEEYNDAVHWTYYSNRDKNGIDTTASIGLKMPFPVIEFWAHSVDPYFQRDVPEGSEFTNTGLLIDHNKTENDGHQFYKGWDIRIPKGIKGVSVDYIDVVKTPNLSDDTIFPDDVDKNDIVTKERQYFRLGTRNYDARPEGDLTNTYISPYNVIKNIVLKDDGTLDISYTHDDNTIFSKIIKWITGVNLDVENGSFTVDFNNGTAQYKTILTWVKDIVLSPEGTLTTKYTSKPDNVEPNKILWWKNLELADTGHWTLTLNNNTTKTFLTRFIKYVNITDDGTIAFRYSDDPQFNKDPANKLDYYLKVIHDMRINTGEEEGTGNQKLSVMYNTQLHKPEAEKWVDIGNPINYIMDSYVDQEQGNLYVYYSDPARRANSQITYKGKQGWIHIGNLRDYKAFNIGMIGDSQTGFPNNMITGDFSTPNACLNSLRQAYPNGFNDFYKAGKLVIVRDVPSNGVWAFAFTYTGENTGSWSYLGNFGNTVKMTCAPYGAGGVIPAALSNLDNGSIWLIEEDN